MQQSAAFFIVVCQLCAMRLLITNPDIFAANLMNNEMSAIQFKNTKSVSTMQTMLTDMCVPTASLHATGATHVRALAQHLVDPSQGAPSADVPTSSRHMITSLTDPSSPATAPAATSPPATSPPAQQSMPQSPNLNNQLMDMILSLQNQMQMLQQAQQQTKEQAEQVDDGQPRSAKRCRSRGKKVAKK